MLSRKLSLWTNKWQTLGGGSPLSKARPVRNATSAGLPSSACLQLAYSVCFDNCTKLLPVYNTDNCTTKLLPVSLNTDNCTTKLLPVSNIDSSTKLLPVCNTDNCSKLLPVSNTDNCTKLLPVSNTDNCTKHLPVLNTDVSTEHAAVAAGALSSKGMILER